MAHVVLQMCEAACPCRSSDLLLIPRLLQEAMVRDTAVTALLELYADEDNVEPMHELTARFAPRFAQLIHDVDEGVAVKGVSQLPVVTASHTHLHARFIMLPWSCFTTR